MRKLAILLMCSLLLVGNVSLAESPPGHRTDNTIEKQSPVHAEVSAYCSDCTVQVAIPQNVMEMEAVAIPLSRQVEGDTYFNFDYRERRTDSPVVYRLIPPVQLE